MRQHFGWKKKDVWGREDWKVGAWVDKRWGCPAWDRYFSKIFFENVYRASALL